MHYPLQMLSDVNCRKRANIFAVFLMIFYFNFSAVSWRHSFVSATTSSLGNASPVRHFFYLWYGIPDVDGIYRHWDHEVLPHWTTAVNTKFKNRIGSRHQAPEEIHAPFYPLWGPYSSMSDETLAAQFDMIISTGSNVIVVSWWGQSGKSHSVDSQGVSTDDAVYHLFIIAEIYNRGKPIDKQLYISFHLEPYPGRSVETVREDIEYIFGRYSNFSALYRERHVMQPEQQSYSWGSKPVFYVYDSYHISAQDWNKVLSPNGEHSVRGTLFDAVFMGLWLDKNHGQQLVEAGFDGIYTYFAADGFSYGSTSRNWEDMCSLMRKHNMLCDLSVGPGYDDTGIRPWNTHNYRSREGGNYYAQQWRNALAANPSSISITSFNEWGEGTQIEPAAYCASQLQKQQQQQQQLQQLQQLQQQSGKDFIDDKEIRGGKFCFIATKQVEVECEEQGRRHSARSDAYSIKVHKQYRLYDVSPATKDLLRLNSEDEAQMILKNQKYEEDSFIAFDGQGEWNCNSGFQSCSLSFLSSNNNDDNKIVGVVNGNTEAAETKVETVAAAADAESREEKEHNKHDPYLYLKITRIFSKRFTQELIGAAWDVLLP